MLRKACKIEIDELWNSKDEGAVKFLKLLEQKYKSWKDKEVKFKEEELKDSKLKHTLTKCMIHYHPDKAKSANPAIFKAKDIYLRKEIAKIINSITNDMKGFD